MNTFKKSDYIKLHSKLQADLVGDFINRKEKNVAVYKKMVELFFVRHDRYPTASEFVYSNLLPAGRTIQRNYGGLEEFRGSMNLPVLNYTKGDARVEKMKGISKRAKHYEQELYVSLHKKYHNPDKGIVVQREPVISGYDPSSDIYGYKRADVAIYNYLDPERKTMFIDFFYASTKETLYGCVNIKNKKIKGLVSLEEIIYVSVNPKFTKEDIDSFTLPKNSPRVLSKEEFVEEYLK